MGAFRLSDHLIDIRNILNSKTGSIRCISFLNSDGEVSLAKGQQIIGPIPTHPNLELVKFEKACKFGLMPEKIGFILIFICPDDEGLAFGGYPGKYFDPLAEIGFIQSQKLIINCVCVIIEIFLELADVDSFLFKFANTECIFLSFFILL